MVRIVEKRQPQGAVQLASDKEVLAAARRALHRTGFTIDQLRAQAEESRFQSEEARRVWFVVGPVADRL
jgi:hypothetical protein